MAGMAIAGKVINRQVGESLEDVDIEVKGPDGNGATKSGSDGTFKVEVVVAGEYEMIASKSGFEQEVYGPLSVMEGTTLTLTLGLHPDMS